MDDGCDCIEAGFERRFAIELRLPDPLVTAPKHSCAEQFDVSAKGCRSSCIDIERFADAHGSFPAMCIQAFTMARAIAINSLNAPMTDGTSLSRRGIAGG